MKAVCIMRQSLSEWSAVYMYIHPTALSPLADICYSSVGFCLGTEVPRHSAGCVGTYVRTCVRTYVVRRFSQCARASAACMLYTLNRVSNVFIACK